jgi:hypothetical protein
MSKMEICAAIDALNRALVSFSVQEEKVIIKNKILELVSKL